MGKMAAGTALVGTFGSSSVVEAGCSRIGVDGTPINPCAFADAPNFVVVEPT